VIGLPPSCTSSSFLSPTLFNLDLIDSSCTRESRFLRVLACLVHYQSYLTRVEAKNVGRRAAKRQISRGARRNFGAKPFHQIAR